MKGLIVSASVLCAVLTCTTADESTDSDPPPSCPPYTHKNDVRIGSPRDLPEGYFVFDRDTIPGLYKSPLKEFKSSLIPATKNTFPRSISISNDGQWIFFVDSKSNVPYLIRGNGCFKTIVPTIGVPLNGLCPGGFYRNSPYGEEIFYLAGSQEVHALQVTFTANGPIFGNNRTIARLSSLRLNPGYTIQYAVSRDQIFGEISPIITDSTSVLRTGFLTIPDNGTGIATDVDIYKWANDDFRLVEGCGHTMSFDGQFVLANAGPQFYSSAGCVPTGHKGFYVAPFRRVGDPAVDLYTEHLLTFGVSLNWCPEHYRSSDHNFWGWYFTNSNRYVAGRMISLKHKSGGWMVDWQNSIWTMLCPADSNIIIQQPAAYIGQIDTGNRYIDTSCQRTDTIDNPDIDRNDPVYRVVSPNGGELFHLGEPCTVNVASLRSGNAILFLCLEDGRYNVLLSTSNSFDPKHDSMFVVAIPDSFDLYGKKVPSVSEKCSIKIEDYHDRIRYHDESDSFFQITP